MTAAVHHLPNMRARVIGVVQRQAAEAHAGDETSARRVAALRRAAEFDPFEQGLHLALVDAGYMGLSEYIRIYGAQP